MTQIKITFEDATKMMAPLLSFQKSKPVAGMQMKTNSPKRESYGRDQSLPILSSQNAQTFGKYMRWL
jgi:hypothetical protein